jgi:cytochrome c biogenesis factor
MNSDTEYGFTEAPEEYVHVPIEGNSLPPKACNSRKTLLRNNLLALASSIAFLPFLYIIYAFGMSQTDVAAVIFHFVQIIFIISFFFFWGNQLLRVRKQHNILSIMSFVILCFALALTLIVQIFLGSSESFWLIILTSIMIMGFIFVPCICMYLGLMARVWQTKRVTQRENVKLGE